ncbi:hypothetical protein KAS50_09825, partial [bacterium]|nr:hypothetical protein [bacterium]
ETYYGTAVEFPSSYNDIIRSSDTGLPGIFGEEINIRLGPASMAEDAVQVIDDVLASSGSEPLLITTIENRAIGKELNLEIDMESILGEDYTMPLGIKADYYDETVFPKKITEIYPGRKNYLLLSTDYTETMAAENLESTLEELLSETLPLIKNALDNLIAKIEQTIQKNIAYVVELQSTLAEKVASIAGIAEDNGTWYCSVFSPENPRIVQKPFAKPQFKNVYISNGVLHKRADAYHENGYSLETAQTTLIILSNAIDIHFLAEGGTEYVDTLESPIDLKMIIYDEQLEENDFANADKDRIKIYYYNSDSLKWAYIGGMRSADTVSASISQMGTYALGIEAGLEVDNIVPEVYDTGPGNVTIHDTKPEI